MLIKPQFLIFYIFVLHYITDVQQVNDNAQKLIEGTFDRGRLAFPPLALFALSLAKLTTIVRTNYKQLSGKKPCLRQSAGCQSDILGFCNSYDANYHVVKTTLALSTIQRQNVSK